MYCVVPVTRLCQSMYSNVNITTYCVVYPSRVGHFFGNSVSQTEPSNLTKSDQNKIELNSDRKKSLKADCSVGSATKL